MQDNVFFPLDDTREFEVLAWYLMCMHVVLTVKYGVHLNVLTLTLEVFAAVFVALLGSVATKIV